MVNSSIEELFNSIENSTLYKRYQKMSDILSKDSNNNIYTKIIKGLREKLLYTSMKDILVILYIQWLMS